MERMLSEKDEKKMNFITAFIGGRVLLQALIALICWKTK